MILNYNFVNCAQCYDSKCEIHGVCHKCRMYVAKMAKVDNYYKMLQEELDANTRRRQREKKEKDELILQSYCEQHPTLTNLNDQSYIDLTQDTQDSLDVIMVDTGDPIDYLSEYESDECTKDDIWKEIEKYKYNIMDDIKALNSEFRKIKNKKNKLNRKPKYHNYYFGEFCELFREFSRDIIAFNSKTDDLIDRLDSLIKPKAYINEMPCYTVIDNLHYEILLMDSKINDLYNMLDIVQKN